MPTDMLGAEVATDTYCRRGHASGACFKEFDASPAFGGFKLAVNEKNAQLRSSFLGFLSVQR